MGRILRNRAPETVCRAYLLALALVAQPVEAQNTPPTPAAAVADTLADPGFQPDDHHAAELADEPKKNGLLGRFKDEEDKGLDFSNILANGGFIPVPIIISEPAVKGGFGIAAAFLSSNPERPREVTKTVGAAFKTGNGSNGIAAFRGGYAFDGRLDYRIAIAHANITLDAFPVFAPQGLEYTNRYDYGVLASANWHLSDRRFSLGPMVDFRKLRSELDIIDLPEDFGRDFNKKLQTGALGIGFHFDSRDNTLTPREGVNAFFHAKLNRGAFGSDRDYEIYSFGTYAFDSLSHNLRGGLKVDLKAIRGNFPAYFAPSIGLRGVQALEFQGMNVLSAELEGAWQISPRWSLVAFGGLGAADSGSRRIFADSGSIWAGGGGFRYRLARKLGFDAGVDVAFGPGGPVVYLQFGHAWILGMD